jgi:hypothetical protein
MIFSHQAEPIALPDGNTDFMRSKFIVLFSLVVILLLASEPSLAQCAMCKQTLENAEQAATAARGMNTAIAVLFLPPVMMFVGIFTLIYRQRNKQDEE